MVPDVYLNHQCAMAFGNSISISVEKMSYVFMKRDCFDGSDENPAYCRKIEFSPLIIIFIMLSSKT